jgi:SAM-dependent methyltransferase
MTDEEFNKIVPNGRDATYGKCFFKNLERAHGWCNLLFGKVLAMTLAPKSVVEFGCATGGVLQSLIDSGARVTGIEKNPEVLPFAGRYSRKLQDSIIIHDLTQPWEPPGGRFSYELAVTIEMLEHLPEEAADVIVHSICRSAPLAVTTACPPVGRNPLHLNEQPPSYWVEKFAQEGFVPDELLTKALCSIMRGFHYMFERRSCPVVPAWFFSSYFQTYRYEGQ